MRLKTPRLAVLAAILGLILFGGVQHLIGEESGPADDPSKKQKEVSPVAVTPHPEDGSPVKSAPPNGVAGTDKKEKEKTEKEKTDKDWWDKVNVIGTAIGAIGSMLAAGIAALAAYWSYRIAKQSEDSAKADRLTTLLADLGKLEYFSDDELKHPEDANVANKALTNINIIEKIGFIWDQRLIDRAAAAKVFGDGLILLYDQIAGLGPMPSLNRTGPELIQENKYAQKLYASFKRMIPAPRA